MDPTPTKTELEKLYGGTGYFERPEDSYSYSTDTLDLLPCLQAQVRQFQSYLAGERRLLDVGCATGEFLELAMHQKLDVLGLEISEYACAKARSKGLRLLQGDLSLPELSPSSFNGIRVSHVLEHLPDPEAALCRVRELLAPRGALYVEVPLQFDSALDIYMSLFESPMPFGPFSIHHLSFFTPTSLKTLLNRTGFEILSLETFLPCRRSERKPSMRLMMLQTLLWLADKMAKRGDVISVWARRRA